MKNQKLIFAAVTLVLFAGAAHAALQGQLGVLDVSGTNPATGTAWAAGDQYRLAFITSAPHNAMSTDIADYNAFVQGLADDADLGDAVWYVIGSTDEVDARDNTSTNPTVETGSPVLLVDGTTIVANNNADLWDGEIAHIINQTEAGATYQSWPLTGTVLDGTAAPGDFGPLGRNISGNVTQGNGSSTTQWIWRTWTGKPAATNNLPMYAMSETLVVIDDDPAMPSVDAGVDMITWLGEPVALDPNVVNKVYSELTFAWSSVSPDPNVVVVFDPAVDPADPNTSNIEAPIVTITLVEGEVAALPITVRLTLAVNNVGSGKTDVTNTMKIDVYADSCLAAQAVAPVEFDPADLNQDCITDLIDFAEMAATWLNDHALSGPVAK